MKKIAWVTIFFLAGFVLFGCGAKEQADPVNPENEEISSVIPEQTDPESSVQTDDGALTVGRGIAIGDITEFVYTYDHINYNAEYQRYRFYAEDGKHMFFHERREVEDDYGPATEEDVTMTGTFELSEEEWEEFFGLLRGGTVTERGTDVLDGDAGPWTYLYWKNDESIYQEYSFASWSALKAFEEFCASLARQNR